MVQFADVGTLTAWGRLFCPCRHKVILMIKMCDRINDIIVHRNDTKSPAGLGEHCPRPPRLETESIELLQIVRIGTLFLQSRVALVHGMDLLPANIYIATCNMYVHTSGVGRMEDIARHVLVSEEHPKCSTLEGCQGRSLCQCHL